MILAKDKIITFSLAIHPPPLCNVRNGRRWKEEHTVLRNAIKDNTKFSSPPASLEETGRSLKHRPKMLFKCDGNGWENVLTDFNSL